MIQAVTLGEKGIWLGKFRDEQYLNCNCKMPEAVKRAIYSLWIEFYI